MRRTQQRIRAQKHSNLEFDRLLGTLRSLSKHVQSTSLTPQARDETLRVLQSLLRSIRGQSEASAPSGIETLEVAGAWPVQLRTELRRHTEDVQGTIHDLCQLFEQAFSRTDPTISKRLAYLSLIRRIRHVVQRVVKPDATIVVVSKGDDELLNLGQCRAWHFPQCKDGTYAGFHPADSADAIAHLEDIRAKGGTVLLFPQSSLWWLHHFRGFATHLERTSRVLYGDDDTCWMFDLCHGGLWEPALQIIADWKLEHRSHPAILNWATGIELTRLFPECAVFEAPVPGLDTLPYIAQSIPIVAVEHGNIARLQEARRVATRAVLVLAPTDGGRGRLVTIEQPRDSSPRRAFLHPNRRSRHSSEGASVQ